MTTASITLLTASAASTADIKQPSDTLQIGFKPVKSRKLEETYHEIIRRCQAAQASLESKLHTSEPISPPFHKFLNWIRLFVKRTLEDRFNGEGSYEDFMRKKLNTIGAAITDLKQQQFYLEAQDNVLALIENYKNWTKGQAKIKHIGSTELTINYLVNFIEQRLTKVGVIITKPSTNSEDDKVILEYITTCLTDVDQQLGYPSFLGYLYTGDQQQKIAAKIAALINPDLTLMAKKLNIDADVLLTIDTSYFDSYQKAKNNVSGLLGLEQQLTNPQLYREYEDVFISYLEEQANDLLGNSHTAKNLIDWKKDALQQYQEIITKNVREAKDLMQKYLEEALAAIEKNILSKKIPSTLQAALRTYLTTIKTSTIDIRKKEIEATAAAIQENFRHNLIDIVAAPNSETKSSPQEQLTETEQRQVLDYMTDCLQASQTTAYSQSPEQFCLKCAGSSRTEQKTAAVLATLFNPDLLTLNKVTTTFNEFNLLLKFKYENLSFFHLDPSLIKYIPLYNSLKNLTNDWHSGIQKAKDELSTRQEAINNSILHAITQIQEIINDTHPISANTNISDYREKLIQFSAKNYSKLVVETYKEAKQAVETLLASISKKMHNSIINDTALSKHTKEVLIDRFNLLYEEAQLYVNGQLQHSQRNLQKQIAINISPGNEQLAKKKLQLLDKTSELYNVKNMQTLIQERNRHLQSENTIDAFRKWLISQIQKNRINKKNFRSSSRDWICRQSYDFFEVAKQQHYKKIIGEMTLSPEEAQWLSNNLTMVTPSPELLKIADQQLTTIAHERYISLGSQIIDREVIEMTKRDLEDYKSYLPTIITATNTSKLSNVANNQFIYLTMLLHILNNNSIDYVGRLSQFLAAYANAKIVLSIDANEQQAKILSAINQSLGIIPPTSQEIASKKKQLCIVLPEPITSPPQTQSPTATASLQPCKP